MSARFALPLMLLLLGLLAPASASAATARVVTGTGSTGVQFGGDLGETNDVTVTHDGSSIVFHDAGAPVHVDGCEQVDEHTARCPPPSGPAGFVWVLAADGNDTVHVVDVTGVFVGGGAGMDTLSTDVGGNRLDGGSGSDVLTGSTGDDILVGAQGNDRLSALAGDDQLAGDEGFFYVARGTDSIDGGPGTDVALYAKRGARVNIDLRRAGGQGFPGENDVLSGIEGVNTGGGADRVVAPISSVTCGGRSDEVILPQAETLIGGDCERTRMVPSLVAFTSRWTLRADGLFSLPLLAQRRCDAWVALFSPEFGRVGHVMVRLRRGREAVARVLLSERGRLRVTVRDCGPLLTFSLQL
jgi:RTX calcium-binding nonapeptide repeat (4 copies)